MTEDIYQNLVRGRFADAPESIHLCSFPVADERLINKELEENMEHVLSVVIMGRACRNSSGMKTVSRCRLCLLKLRGPFRIIIPGLLRTS